MKRLCLSLALLATAITFTTNAQKNFKPWQEWSRNDAERILNDSPWGKTQVETDVSEMMFRPQAAPDARSGKSNADPERDSRGGATNQATTIKYRIRFLSAKPIRQAFARLIAFDQPAEDANSQWPGPKALRPITLSREEEATREQRKATEGSDKIREPPIAIKRRNNR